jgi:hypothetical protein
MAENPETTPTPDEQAPAQQSREAAEAAAGKPWPETMSVDVVIDYIQAQRAFDPPIRRAEAGQRINEVERIKILKAIRAGAFPAPAKPEGKLERSETGGDIDWTSCDWAKADIDFWLQQDRPEAAQFAEAWKSHKITPWRDVPALASHIARRVMPGESEWEHWADCYRPRAYVGPFVRLLVIGVVTGLICFALLAPLGAPLTQTNDAGEVLTEAGYYYTTVESPDGLPLVDSPMKRYRVAKEADGSGNTLIVVGDAGSNIGRADLLTRPVNPAEPDGAQEPVALPKFEYRTNEKGNLVDAKGEIITDAAGNALTPDSMAPEKFTQGVPKTHSLGFLAAPLPGNPIGADWMNVPWAIFIIVVGVLAIITILRFLYNWLSLSYTLTDSRLIIRKGILARTEQQIRVHQIEDLVVNQSIIQLMLRVGRITIFSNDVDTPELTLEGVRSPRAVKDRIFAVSEAAKTGAGYYLESSGQKRGAPLRG